MTGLTIERRKPNKDGLRWCSKGKHYTDPNNFRRLTDAPDGKSYDCKECCRKRCEDYNKRKRESSINPLLGY